MRYFITFYFEDKITKHTNILNLIISIYRNYIEIKLLLSIDNKNSGCNLQPLKTIRLFYFAYSTVRILVTAL